MEYFVGGEDGVIQNVCFRSLQLKKEKNCSYVYHNHSIVDIKINKDPYLSQALYLLSLDSSNKLAIWNLKRSRLGPLFVLNFDV